MNEDFVPFELAVKLKEKGFREKCLTFYDVEDNVGLLYNTQYFDEFSPCQYTDLLASFNSGDGEAHLDHSDNCIDAPTISQVLKWLREEENIHVCISFSDNIGALWEYDVVLLDGAIYRASNDGFVSYEEAALAGIEYALSEV